MAGFTTVRKIGTVHVNDELIAAALSEAILKGWVKGPDVIAAGHIIPDACLVRSTRVFIINAIQTGLGGARSE